MTAPELKTPDALLTKRDLFHAVSELMFALGIRSSVRAATEARLATVFNNDED